MMNFNVHIFLAKRGIKPADILKRFLLRYWAPRQEREKQGIIIAAALFFIAVYFWGVWQPVNRNIAQQQTTRQQLEQLQSKLAAWEKSMPVRKNAPKDVSDDLPALITGYAENFSITIEKINVEEETVQIEVEPVAFTHLLKWLNQLREEEGFKVSQLAVIATRPGEVAVQHLELVYHY